MMRLRQTLRAWPIAIKVPLIVAALMVTIGIVISNQVLVRLSETQQRNLEKLANAYLDGLSSSVLPHVFREDVWEIFDQIDRARRGYESVETINTIITSADGVILAASDPRLFPTQQKIPGSLTARFPANSNLVLDAKDGRAFIRRALIYQGRPLGWIYAQIDIRDLLAERDRVLSTLILTNALLTLMFAGIGYLAMRRMVKPIGILAAHLEQGRDGLMEPIDEALIGPPRSEFGRLFLRYNAMVRALNERGALATRLAEEERLGSLGRLASGMAHEINNPLGGMLNAIDTIEAHGDDPLVRADALRIVKRGLVGIRDVVRSALVTYKGSQESRPLRSMDLDDLRYLIAHEASRRQLVLTWRNELSGTLPVPAGPIRQTVLNLLLNACAASPVGGCVKLEARQSETGDLMISVADEGPGLPGEAEAILNGTDPARGPQPQGTGLGMWMVRRLVDDMGGHVEAHTRPGGGTSICLVVPCHHDSELRHVA